MFDYSQSTSDLLRDITVDETNGGMMYSSRPIGQYSIILFVYVPLQVGQMASRMIRLPPAHYSVHVLKTYFQSTRNARRR